MISLVDHSESSQVHFKAHTEGFAFERWVDAKDIRIDALRGIYG